MLWWWFGIPQPQESILNPIKTETFNLPLLIFLYQKAIYIYTYTPNPINPVVMVAALLKIVVVYGLGFPNPRNLFETP